MKIAFVGSREFPDKKFVEYTTEKYLMDGWVDFVSKVVPNEFISGGAKGVDSWAEAIARDLDKLYGRCICWVYPADWTKHGKRAGFIRNEIIVKEADFIVAFWDGESKGTKHTIDLAIRAKKPIDIYIRKTI